MLKILIIAGFLSFNAFADKVTEAEIQSQGAEPNAVTPTTDPCMSKSAVKKFEKKSLKETIPFLKKNPDPPNVPHSSFLNIGIALINAGLMKSEFLGKNANEASTRLANQGFVNLLECPSWKKKLGNGESSAVPVGAIMLYESENKKDPLGSIRMKSTKGCLVAGPKTGKCRKLGVSLIGIYVKDVN